MLKFCVMNSSKSLPSSADSSLPPTARSLSGAAFDGLGTAEIHAKATKVSYMIIIIIIIQMFTYIYIYIYI